MSYKEGGGPEGSWTKTNNLRWYYTKLAQLNTPNPKLQVMWQCTNGDVRWEDIPIEFEE